MEDLPGLKSAIATVLRRVRREARLSQQKLADFAGLSRIHIAQLEGRRQNPQRLASYSDGAEPGRALTSQDDS